MYKLIEDIITHSIIGAQRISNNAGIPFDPDNTDYQTFKKDLAEGASLKDAEGTDMTAEQIAAFLQGLT